MRIKLKNYIDIIKNREKIKRHQRKQIRKIKDKISSSIVRKAHENEKYIHVHTVLSELDISKLRVMTKEDNIKDILAKVVYFYLDDESIEEKE